MHDLTKPLKEKYDVAIAANVLISHQPEMLVQMLQHIAGAIKKGGHLIVVVPSMESSLFVYHKILKIRVSRGESASKAKNTLKRKFNQICYLLPKGL